MLYQAGINVDTYKERAKFILYAQNTSNWAAKQKQFVQNIWKKDVTHEIFIQIGTKRSSEITADIFSKCDH
jgi:hypothetical protein